MIVSIASCLFAVDRLDRGLERQPPTDKDLEDWLARLCRDGRRGGTPGGRDELRDGLLSEGLRILTGQVEDAGSIEQPVAERKTASDRELGSRSRPLGTLGTRAEIARLIDWRGDGMVTAVDVVDP